MSQPSFPPSAGGDPDPRIHFDRLTGKWKFEDDASGKEYEYDDGKATWVECVDDEVIKRQQEAYSVQGVDEQTPAAPVLNRGKKRKKQDNDDDDTPAILRGKVKKSNSSKASTSAAPPPRQTAVFVSNLPSYTTVELLHRTFLKGGVILESSDGEPKIKMYYDSEGRFKGEALVVYLREESVVLATTLLDDTILEREEEEGKPGAEGGEGNRMRVVKAEFGKKMEVDSTRNGEAGGRGGGNGNGMAKSEEMKKKKQGKQAEKLKMKLTDWSSDEEDALKTLNKLPKIVILRKMFTLAELEEDPSLLLDLKEDVREECGKLGEVTNVVLYDKEPEGIMSIRFKDELSAQACVLKMNNRFFGGRQIQAALLEGKPKFRKSADKEAIVPDKATEEEEKKRMDDWNKWLEEGGE
ncbi:hypothetical protein BT69DRAFT_1285235 [Atractiella rhizophila]|nr:hypothetical protein BT69DRAFT_1285235 [Atractiella rhizophila]